MAALMFVVQEAVAVSNAQAEDDLGKAMMAYMIMLVNAAAAAAYPAYKFVNAWAESGEVDMAVVKASLWRAMTCLLGTSLAGQLASTCGILVTAKEKVDSAKAEADRMKDELADMELLQGESAVRAYEKAQEGKEKYDEAKEKLEEVSDLYQETMDAAQAVKSSVKSIKNSLQSPCAGEQQQNSTDIDHDVASETGAKEEDASLYSIYQEIDESQLELTPGMKSSFGTELVFAHYHRPRGVAEEQRGGAASAEEQDKKGACDQPKRPRRRIDEIIKAIPNQEGVDEQQRRANLMAEKFNLREEDPPSSSPSSSPPAPLILTPVLPLQPNLEASTEPFPRRIYPLSREMNWSEDVDQNVVLTPNNLSEAAAGARLVSLNPSISPSRLSYRRMEV